MGIKRQERLIVGAHYGLRDWLAQRITAVVMLVYTIAVVVAMLAIPKTQTAWQALFAHLSIKVLTLLTFLGLAWHAWIGMRDIWMDYIKPAGLRLLLHVLTLLWLLAITLYAFAVVWRV